MKKIWLLSLTIISLGMPLFFSWHSLPSSKSQAPTVTPKSAKTIRYEQRTLAQSIVHILWVPTNSRFVVTPALSPQGNTVEEFARKHQAKAIINAGFFDPVNHKSTSYVVISGQVVADPKDNERLVNNPKLKPYLNQIFNRTEFRRYLCGQTIRYDIVLHSETAPAGCQLVDAVGAGPSLLPEIASEQEGFVDNAKGRDALGSTQPNARTAVGVTGEGDVILVMAAQKPSDVGNSGLSLKAIANLLKTLGANKAMNLDGGSSSSLYYNGKTFYGKLDAQSNSIKRPVKSVLLVQEN